MKIRLGSNADIEKLEDVLASSVERYMQKHVSTSGVTEHQKTILREQLAHMTASVVEKLKHNILVEVDASDENSDPYAGKNGMLGSKDSFMPSRDEDDETLALLSELRVLSERAAEQRSVVPAMVKDKLVGQLETLRPSAEDVGAVASTARPSLEPAPEDLRKQLSDATDNMPQLRARLEEALSRLQRVVEAVEAEHSRPLPSTMEKAVEGSAEFVQDGGASPAVKAAMASGKISTRRRLARDLRPVPYPM